MAAAVQLLQLSYFPVLSAHFALILFLSFRFRKELAAPFRELDEKALALLGLVFLLGLYLRLNMSGRYGLDALLWEHVSNAEDVFSGLRFTGFTHPGGHSFLVALSFLFGRNIENASLLTMLLDGLSVPLLFFIAFLLFRRTALAVMAALIFAVLPWQIFISGAGLDVTSSLFFVLASLLVLLLSRELKSGGLLGLALLLLAWAAAIRVENMAFLSVFPLVYFREPYPVPELRRFALPLGFFFIPALVWLACSPLKFGTASSAEGAGIPHSVSLANLAVNYRDHIIPHFLSGKTRYPFLLLPLLVLGSVKLVFSRQKEPLYILSIWFFFWSLIYGGYWYGSQIYRYSILIHPVLAVVAACGGYLLLQAVRGAVKNGTALLAAFGGLSACIVFSAFSPRQLLRPAPVHSWPSVREFAAMDKKLPADSCILLQRLKYGRFENARRLTGRGRRVVQWPAPGGLFEYNCPAIYYLDLRAYAHPVPEDLRLYDEAQASLFKEYELAGVLNEGPLAAYQVLKKRK